MLSVEVVSTKYPVELKKMIDSKISSLHKQGFTVTKIDVFGDATYGFVAVLQYDDAPVAARKG